MKKPVINLDKLHLTLLGIILVGGILFFINRNHTPSHLHNPYKSQLDSLSQVIQRYISENESLKQEYERYYILSNNYSKQIDSITLNLHKSRTYYEKQIKNLSTFTPSELYHFITDRYK